MIVIYTYFSKDDSTTLEGKDTLTYFQQSDFPFESLQSITANNYWIRFISLSNNCISKLQYLPIHGHQTKAGRTPSIDQGDLIQWHCGYGEDDDDPGQARDAADDDYYYANEPYDDGIPICQFNNTVWYSTSRADATLERHFGIIYADLSTKAELILPPPSSLSLIDLSNFTGPAHVFLRVNNEGHFTAYDNPFDDNSKVDNKYHAYSETTSVSTIYKSGTLAANKPVWWYQLPTYNESQPHN